VRFSRDKRGYEHTYLIDASTRGGRAARARVLYWFRTPPGVKVGRQPFDDEMRRTLERQNPNLLFDWKAIVSTPPPPEPEPWRERRRLERLAKQARLTAPVEVSAEPEFVPLVDGTLAPPPPAEAAAPGAAASTGGRRRRRGRRRRGGGQRPATPGTPGAGGEDAITAAGEAGPEGAGSEPLETLESSDHGPGASNQEE
jgi:hypothetical protein